MDTNNEYVKSLIKKCNKVVIDTSSLLGCNRLNNFLSNNKSIFLELGKKMLVPDCAMAELAKHAYSNNDIKRKKSLNALEILRHNKDLFEFDEEYILPDGEENFADPKILKYLLENRRRTSQLLISNDQGLTKDAFYFNKMESFYNNRINVCYLTNSGEMNMCDCSRENKEEIIKLSENKQEQSKTVNNNEEITSLDKYGKPILYFLGGVITYASIKPLIKIIKGVM